MNPYTNPIFSSKKNVLSWMAHDVYSQEQLCACVFEVHKTTGRPICHFRCQPLYGCYVPSKRTLSPQQTNTKSQSNIRSRTLRGIVRVALRQDQTIVCALMYMFTIDKVQQFNCTGGSLINCLSPNKGDPHQHLAFLGRLKPQHPASVFSWLSEPSQT